MTSEAIIEEIKKLPPTEQVEVIRFTLGLSGKFQLTSNALGKLARRLAVSNDPAERIRLKSIMPSGFYGD